MSTGIEIIEVSEAKHRRAQSRRLAAHAQHQDAAA